VAQADAATFERVKPAGQAAIGWCVHAEVQVVDGAERLAVGVVDPAANEFGGSHRVFPGIRPMILSSTQRRKR
jgi:hypothetical protein